MKCKACGASCVFIPGGALPAWVCSSRSCDSVQNAEVSKPRYSGPNRSGICICGCGWELHHLHSVMNTDYATETGETYFPDECNAFGSNQFGGMKLVGSEWVDHCHQYKDT